MSADETERAAREIGFDWRSTPLAGFLQDYLDKK
jgi:hypothetical protein